MVKINPLAARCNKNPNTRGICEYYGKPLGKPQTFARNNYVKTQCLQYIRWGWRDIAQFFIPHTLPRHNLMVPVISGS